MAANSAANAKSSGVIDDSTSKTPVHTFDPDASPQQKAAAAGKSKTQLKSVMDEPGSGEREVQIDTGSSNVVPTINISNHDDKPTNENQHNGDSDPTGNAAEDALDMPGGEPSDVTPVIPDWYKVGWRAVSGIDNPPVAEGEAKDLGVLDMFLDEQYYGSWFHNAAVIIFAVFASHFLTRFNFGWGWLFIVLATCSTYYSTSMVRVRRRARDDIQRDLVKTRLETEHESADWMNNFLDRFWLIYEPVLSKTIVSSVDQILSTNTPTFLDSIRLTEFTLGTKSVRIDKVRTFPKTASDEVTMDWGISFTPNDVSDLTPRQLLSKTNPKIVLSIRVGKGLTATMPILVEDINFSGVMRLKMKLMTNFPHVQTVGFCFLEKPVIDYVLKPIGGETFGFDIASIPGLSSFIREMTHATLQPMMYDPNVFTLNLEQLLSGTPLDTAVGVLQVTIRSARGIKGTKFGGGTPDPYVSLSIENRTELARTKFKNNTYNPTWMETKFLLVNNLAETLNLTAFDYNDHRKNTLLGAASFELSALLEDATREDITSPLLKDGKDCGELKYDISYYPVLTPEVGSEEDVMDTTVGIVRLVIHQAKDLDATKSMSGDLNPLAKVYLGNSTLIHTTPRFKHTTAPVWESPHEFLCSDKAKSVITVKVIDDRDVFQDPVIGYMSIKLEDLLSSKAEGKDWFNLSNCQTGKVRVSAQWKPLNMAGSLHGADQYTPPIGAVRIFLNQATDVKNVEAMLGGKSDPYVRVQVNNVTKGRTEVVNNNLNPVWGEFVYIPVHSLKETILLECMDYQHITQDRSLGSCELTVSELAKESGDKRFPYASTGRKEAIEPLRQNGKEAAKGNLYFTAQFEPALALKGVGFAAATNEIERAAQGEEDSGGGNVSDSGSESSSDEEAQAVPVGVTVSHHTKAAKSVDTVKTVESTKTTGTTEQPTADDGLVSMTKGELLQQQSGIIVFNVLGGKLEKKARLEVLLDDGYWPAFTTMKARSTTAQWEYVGEGFVKELDFGRVWLRLNEADEGDKDDVIAEWKGNAKSFLEDTLEKPSQFTLMDIQGRPTSTVELEARYVPVPVKLDPRESINNQGTLRVDLLDGREIRGVDRGGKSDPFAVFSLNDQKVYKSQTKKKTLTPEWNENFTVQVPSRVDGNFEIQVFDWNQIEAAKLLGEAKILLSDLEPFEAAERLINLGHGKHGEAGQVRLRLLFTPEIISKNRKNTSTFSTAGRAMTQIGGLPVGAGKGAIHGVTSIFKKSGKEDHADVPPVPDVPSGQASQPVGQSDTLVGGASSFPSVQPDVPPSSEPGTLRVTILDAKDFSHSDAKPYVIVRVGDKEHKTKHVGKTNTPEWNETFNFAAGSLTPSLHLWVHDHKTLGKDKQLGTAEINIWRHIKPTGVSSADVFAELREGGGLLRVRLEFDADNNPLQASSSTSSVDRTNSLIPSTSISSPSRFSLRGRRPGATEQDD